MTQPPEGIRFEQPLEGVHYLTNLYSVVGVDSTADLDTIHEALRSRTKEYTTDRQVGTAPEFGETAERMMLLLNRAREILLIPDKRSEYDGLLAAWEGPISQDGIPVIMLDGAFAPKIVGETAEQVETRFQQLLGGLEQQPGLGSEERVARIEHRLERARSLEADDEEINDLQDDYEDALFGLDMRLAVEEQQRSQRALGRDISNKDGKHWRVSENYGQEAVDEITEIRERKIEDLAALASGSFATRLALLAGEATVSADVAPIRDAADYALPVYFDDQAARVEELARKRQEIMQKRTDNLRISYPEESLQTELKDRAVVGLAAEDGTDWYVISGEELPVLVTEQLLSGNYASVISSGYNVIITKQLENIMEDVLVRKAFAMHAERYN